MTYRCCTGLEPPEVAKAFLANGTYQPHFAIDMWAFGFLLMDLLYGKMPACHKECLIHPDFQAALQWGVNMDPRDVPGFKRHLIYLAGLPHDFAYASKVLHHLHCISTLVFSSALEQMCMMMQSCRFDKRHMNVTAAAVMSV